MRPTMRTRSRRGRLSSSWATQHVFEDHRRVVNAVLEGREVDRVLGERAAHGCVDQIGDAPVGLGRLDTEGPVKIGVKGNGGSLDDFAHGSNLSPWCFGGQVTMAPSHQGADLASGSSGRNRLGKPCVTRPLAPLSR